MKLFVVPSVQYLYNVETGVTRLGYFSFLQFSLVLSPQVTVFNSIYGLELQVLFLHLEIEVLLGEISLSTAISEKLRIQQLIFARLKNLDQLASFCFWTVPSLVLSIYRKGLFWYISIFLTLGTEISKSVWKVICWYLRIVLVLGIVFSRCPQS